MEKKTYKEFLINNLYSAGKLSEEEQLKIIENEKVRDVFIVATNGAIFGSHSAFYGKFFALANQLTKMDLRILELFKNGDVSQTEVLDMVDNAVERFNVNEKEIFNREIKRLQNHSFLNESETAEIYGAIKNVLDASNMDFYEANQNLQKRLLYVCEKFEKPEVKREKKVDSKVKNEAKHKPNERTANAGFDEFSKVFINSIFGNNNEFDVFGFGKKPEEKKKRSN